MTARSEPTLDLRGLPAPDLSGEIARRTRAAAPDGGEPPPFPPNRRPVATAAVVVGSLVLLALAGFLLVRSVGLGSSNASPPPATTAPPTACSELIPGCTAERVSDLVLRNGQTLGALGPIDGFDTSGILTSDEALARDGKLEHLGLQAKQVRVVLGSADADRLRWGHGVRLFYAIEWNGVCGGPTSVTEGGSVPIASECTQAESTVLDATTGRFIVGGNEPGGFESPTVPPSGSSPSAIPGEATSCSEILPGCRALRLPDLTLKNGETLGAFGPVDGISLRGILSFDEALRTGGAEAVGLHGTQVRVVLGSADADRLHWGHGTNLYYAIDWGGVCVPAHGPAPPPGTPAPRRTGCALTNWATVIDAHTGEFIVEGNGPDPKTTPSTAVPSSEPLDTDTHTPQAVLVHLDGPLDLRMTGPSGELVLEPGEPTALFVPAQQVVDDGWRRYGDLRPTSVRLAFGTVNGDEFWLMTFDVAVCSAGPNPTQEPGTPEPDVSCISSWTELVNAATGKAGVELGGSIPGW